MSSTDAQSDDVQQETEGPEKPPLSLEVQVDNTSSCQRHVTVTVSREDVDRYLREAFDELKPKAEVPGFRPGRAPRKLVESRFKDQVSEQVKGSLVMDSLTQVSEEQDFSAISEPELDFEAVELPETGAFTFEFDIEVRPDFDMPQWEGLTLNRPMKEFSDEEVDQHLKKVLERSAAVVERQDGGVEKGDRLTVKLTVRHEDRVVTELDAVELRVDPAVSFNDATIDAFDTLMRGARKGDTRTTTVRISENADREALRGQEVEVRLRVQGIRYVKLPKLTPEFLAKLGGFEDEEDVREAVRIELERQFVYRQQQHLREQITATLTKGADWDLPPDLVRRQSRRELERMLLELRSSGFSDEMIQSYANQIRQNSLQVTEKSLKEHFIFERIAEDQEIDASEKDYDAEIENIAMQQNESPRRIRARLEKSGQMDALRNQVIERKVVNLICSKANFVDTPVDEKSDDAFALDLALAGGHDTSQIPEAKHGGDAEELRESVDRR
jgi:trigger factor